MSETDAQPLSGNGCGNWRMLAAKKVMAVGIANERSIARGAEVAVTCLNDKAGQWRLRHRGLKTMITPALGHLRSLHSSEVRHPLPSCSTWPSGSAGRPSRWRHTTSPGGARL